MLKLPIYLDNSATTPIDPRVLDRMLPWLGERFGNPASTHRFGTEARAAVEAARAQVARTINAEPAEVIWTSGATESNNLALKGAAHANRDRGSHLITVRTEHPAVLDVMQELAHEGFEVTRLAPASTGLLDLDALRAAMRPDTVLVSVMFVNNEIGVIQDIAAIGDICERHGALLHVDAAQASGKVEIDVERQKIALMSLTAHKTYGPKGVGALYVSRKREVRLEPQMHGGGQEQGLRSGTLATHQIVGMGECFALAAAEMAGEMPRLRALRDKLWTGLRAFEAVRINGDMTHRIANNLNLSLRLAQSAELIASIRDIAVSSAAACTTGPHAVSHVLQALGLDAELARNAIRITVGRFNTLEEIDFALGYLTDKITQFGGRR